MTGRGRSLQSDAFLNSDDGQLWECKTSQHGCQRGPRNLQTMVLPFTGSKKLLHVKQEESEHVVPSLLRPSRFDLRHSALGFLDKLRLVGMYMGVSENWGTPYFGVLRIRILLFRVLYLGPLFSETPI